MYRLDFLRSLVSGPPSLIREFVGEALAPYLVSGWQSSLSRVVAGNFALNFSLSTISERFRAYFRHIESITPIWVSLGRSLQMIMTSEVKRRSTLIIYGRHRNEGVKEKIHNFMCPLTDSEN